MNFIKVILLAAFFQFQTYSPITLDDTLAGDKRPPVISVAMTNEERLRLTDAENKVSEAEARLEQAKHEKSVLEFEIEKSHNPDKSKTITACQSLEYVPKIVRNYVVYSLEIVQCNPV